MIVLDTNVLSELVRPTPDTSVLSWIDGQDPTELVITALTAAEIRAGLALMPKGRRQREVSQIMEETLTRDFNRRVLAFDNETSPHYAAVVAVRTRSGSPISTVDAQIAAICLQQSASLATRNIADFKGLQLSLINPWQRGSLATT